jgi:hypothetical protein
VSALAAEEKVAGRRLLISSGGARLQMHLNRKEGLLNRKKVCLAPPILPNLQRSRRFGDEFRNDIGLRKHRHVRAFQHESLGTHSARGIALNIGRNGLV